MPPEEAIVNAMVAAETMTGADGYRVYGLPMDQVAVLLRQAGRIKEYRVPSSAVNTEPRPSESEPHNRNVYG